MFDSGFIQLIAALQLLALVVLSTTERMVPATQRLIKRSFWLIWFAVIAVAYLLLSAMAMFWGYVDGIGLEIPNTIGYAVAAYLPYSLINYWIHRFKHKNVFLWRHIHALHHTPEHMESHLAYYRHPLEALFNCAVIVILFKGVFNASFDTVLTVLIIEGFLELFHHSNIRTPAWMRPLGYIVQLPEMHTVHHERGLHRYNYGPFLWDWVFGTLKHQEQPHPLVGLSKAKSVHF